jgi:hypothetical protein
MRTHPAHDQIRRQIENNIAHIKQRQPRGYLFRRNVQHRSKIVAFADVHGLRESDVGSDCGAHEVEDPKRGEDAAVKFTVISLSVAFNFDVRD